MNGSVAPQHPMIARQTISNLPPRVQVPRHQTRRQPSGYIADTTGAIAGMLVGALYGTEAIPDNWLKGLDADIRSLCEMQARALL
ncbi:MAG: ADP-ribosylglycohydrolase family protein [Sideroxydans sp.]|nr:ADP-ribosylglycohydrolase family protein [Sideroxydans sp.]